VVGLGVGQKWGLLYEIDTQKDPYTETYAEPEEAWDEFSIGLECEDP
jgi:hypothetical protein